MANISNALWCATVSLPVSYVCYKAVTSLDVLIIGGHLCNVIFRHVIYWK